MHSTAANLKPLPEGELADFQVMWPPWTHLGVMTITDRSKDVIKSGGEWISSIAIENIAVSHPKVGGGGTSSLRPPHRRA